MMNWYFLPRADYDAAKGAGTLTDEMLVFCSDTRELFRGTQAFNQAIETVASWPSTGVAQGRLYILSSTLEGRIWNGTGWTTVIQPVQTTLDAANTSLPVSGKAVADYVAEELGKLGSSAELVKSVEYVADTNTLKVTTADGNAQNLPMSNVAAELSYDPASGKLQILNAQGVALGSAVNLDLERFITEATYDHNERTITLTFNDNTAPLSIYVGDLVDTYTAENSTSIKLTVTGNKFKAEAIVSSQAGNMLQSTANGLYVAATDISGKVDKVSGATAGDIATLKADGGIQDSGMKAGGATLAATPNATTLATEAAVNAVKSNLTDTMNTNLAQKMAKVNASKSGEVIVASSTGDAQASGVKIGTTSLTGAGNTLAREDAVKAYVGATSVAKADVVGAAEFAAQADAASDTKVPSEKAMVEALTWKTSF